jgi:hypothetical protein
MRKRDHGDSRALQRLWEQDPRCYWCGRNTVLGAYRRGDKYLPARDGATRDHLITRNHAEPGQHRPVVLSCADCNNRRGGKSEAEFRLWLATRYYGFFRDNARHSRRAQGRSLAENYDPTNPMNVRKYFRWMGMYDEAEFYVWLGTLDKRHFVESPAVHGSGVVGRECRELAERDCTPLSRASDSR